MRPTIVLVAALVVALSIVYQPQPLIGASNEPSKWQSPHTKKVINNEFLIWFKAHCDLDLLGHPTTNLLVENDIVLQKFERGILELHGTEVKLRKPVDALLKNDPAIPPAAPNSSDYTYFPTYDGGSGHAIANIIKHHGVDIHTGFKAFFDRCGGVATFGYPKEEPKFRAGYWTQSFSTAIFQYFGELDNDTVQTEAQMPNRNWKVQLVKLDAMAGVIKSQAISSTSPSKLNPPTLNLRLYFVRADGQLQMELRQIPYTSGVLKATVLETLKGPQDGNLQVVIAPQTQLLNLEFVNGVARITLSQHFLQSPNPDVARDSLQKAVLGVAGVKSVQIVSERR